MSDELDIPEGDFEGYIFDNDGTLVVSMHVHFEAWIDAYRDNGARFTLTREIAQSLAGKGMEETVEIINERFGESLDPKKVVEAQEANYRAKIDKIYAYEPVVRFARKMAKTHPVAVASGGVRDTVMMSLRVIGMDDFFPVVVTQDDVEFGKPNPEIFLLAAERMGVNPKRCLVFEDGILGKEGAEAAGMQVVMVNPEGL